MGGGKEQHARLRRKSAHLCFFFVVFLSPSCRPSCIEAATAAARSGTHWTTTLLTDGDDSAPAAILLAGVGDGPGFAFGFFKRRPNDGFLLAISLVLIRNYSIDATTTPEVVWTANRNNPIKGSAALNLTADGDLRLSGYNGNLVWSTNTSGRGVASLNLTVEGNLAMLDTRGLVVWQSYSHPTDTALLNQSLTGMKLVANASATNSSEGTFYLSVNDSSYEAYFVGDHTTPAQVYYKWKNNTNNTISSGILVPLPSYSGRRLNIELQQVNRNSSTYVNFTDTGPRKNGTGQTNPFVNPADFAKKFVRLEADGHLQKYAWLEEYSLWKSEVSLLDNDIGICGYPNVCGSYGICSEGRQCSCPKVIESNTAYFDAVDERKLNEGCRLHESLQPSCGPRQIMVSSPNLSYFSYVVREADMVNVGKESCRQACSSSCSCKAAFLKSAHTEASGDCYLISTVLSVIDNNPETEIRNYTSTAYFKVQLQHSGYRWHLAVALTILTLAGICLGYVVYLRKRNLSSRAQNIKEEDDLLLQFEHMPGMPTRFAYKDLKEATDRFSTKLGEGGFGAVFKGTLRDGTHVAVKVLGYRGQGIKEFLAEVKTIGSIHHLNLVRLVGYCAERLHRLLVYEYLSNGSLENWIFPDEAESNSNKPMLDWSTKMKIILQVAKGLSYLHEECRQRIIHLDIKPQNILLDDNFNAKVSDFGMSKLVERDQSKVVTTMRGTPGYLAPEWLSSVITEKVDVYSFGVVVLETVSGKRILDYSRSQSSFSLLSLLTKAAEENRLEDIIEDGNDSEETMKLVKIAMWCLQMDYTKRPTMPAVVKVLEGQIEVEPAVDFWIPTTGLMILPDASCSSTLQES